MQIPKAIPVQVTDAEASSFSPDAEQPVRVVFSELAGAFPQTDCAVHFTTNRSLFLLGTRGTQPIICGGVRFTNVPGPRKEHFNLSLEYRRRS